MKSRKSLAIAALLLNAAAISGLLARAGEFPDDYNVVIAGAPVYSLLTQTSGLVRNEAFAAPGAGLSETQMTRLHEAALGAVEAGEAPDTVVASREDGKLSRPLCAYPTLARYKGRGDPAEAANFECK